MLHDTGGIAAQFSYQILNFSCDVLKIAWGSSYHWAGIFSALLSVPVIWFRITLKIGNSMLYKPRGLLCRSLVR